MASLRAMCSSQLSSVFFESFTWSMTQMVPLHAGHPDGGVVPQVAADLPDNHGYAVGGEAHVQVGIEVVDGLYKTNAPNLEQVVQILSPVGELLDHRKDQAEVARDELLPGLHVPLLGAAQQLHGLLILEDLQLRCVDTADLYLSLHGRCLPLTD